MTDTLIPDEQGALNALEARVDELVQRCVHLQDEVTLLRRQEQRWSAERTQLLERHATAQTRIEAIVSRLRFLERP
ncbi:cell division protein ZapB [Gammaproteobacteria bacterium]